MLNGEKRMQSLRFPSLSRRSSLLLAVVVLLSCGAFAQSLAEGKGYLPNPLAPYQARTIAPPNFTNSPRIDQLLRGGRLYLSLNDAIALALENNLDIAIARYNLDIADTDLLRAKAGSSLRGVNTGLVSGTPGGSGTGISTSSGGGAGGTSTGAGGAGAGTGGLVQSTTGAGPSIPSFDPFLSSSLSLTRSNTPQSNPFLTGVPFLTQHTGSANISYSQGFVTGTNISVGFNNSRQTTNSIRSTLIPLLNSSLQFQITQPLLAGFGIGVNNRNIRISKNNKEISDIAFRNQVISTVSQIQNIYWDLVNAYEDLRVKQRSLALAQQLLSDTQKQVNIGTQAPIEVVSSQSQVATSQQDLLVSQTNLQLQELLMKNAITRNLQDPVLAESSVIPTDTMRLPATEPVVPTTDLINDALAHRPELAQARIDLTNRNINKQAARNELLPTVNLVASYGSSALAGVPNLTAPGAAALSTTGYGDALTSVFGNDFPTYTVGFQVNIPIRNRSAQADQVRSELEYRQAELSLQQKQNQIRIEVRNAQFTVQQDRARVEANQAAVRLAEQTLDAEQKKYALGASTNYNVMQDQRDLAAAESNLVAATTDYEKARVNLDQVTGNTLNTLGIVISEAETGQVQKLPTVPYVTPRPVEELPVPPSAPATTPQPGAAPQQPGVAAPHPGAAQQPGAALPPAPAPTPAPAPIQPQ
jgi:outer membrane protein TolC